MERPGAINQVRSELATISNARLEKTIKSGARVAMLPIASLWIVFSIREMRTVEEICRKVEQFASVSIPAASQS
jgi:hypothetical protein